MILGGHIKYLVLILAFLLSAQLGAQTVFEEDFETLRTGLDLTTEGYLLLQDGSYAGTVTALVAEGNNNKFARMVSAPNGAAKMQILLTIDVDAGKTYNYELDSKGPFKRQLRIYSEDDDLLGASGDYKPSSDPEISEWKKMELSFIPGPEVTRLKIALYHNWSGTIELDNFKVYEISRQKAFYLSSSEGNDDSAGTENAPWKSLEKISSTSLLPGDTVLFKRGDRFTGHYVVNGSGNEGLPVLITAYGEGEKPIISGQVGAAGGGDYQEAILLENNDMLIFDGLEVQNERLVSRSGVADTDAYGLYVRNSGAEVMRNLVFRNMVFKNVFAVQPILDPDDFNSIQVSGLSFSSAKNTEAGKEKHIREILVEDCYFENLQRFGIKFSHSGGLANIGNDSMNRNMNITCRNNEFYYNGGTSILPAATYNCLIENNVFDHPGASTDPRMPGRGSSVWNINSINTVIQYNMCQSTRGYLDSHGIHIDNWNENTFVQYNYMEDCEGGFVEILKGNKNAVYRFNVSENDGWRVNEKWADSNHTIWVNSDRWGEAEDFAPSDSVFIYNNTVVMDSAYTTSINMDGKNMFVYNNIFSSTDGAGMGIQNMVIRSNETPFFMTNNLFDGNVHPGFIAYDAKPQMGSPMFTGTGEDKYAYELQEGSPAIDMGTNVRGPGLEGAGYGVFKDLPAYPNVDFYGNPIDLSSGSPNIGACNVKYAEDNTDITHIRPEEKSTWRVYPLPEESKIHIINNGYFSGSLEISLINLKGQLVQREMKSVQAEDKFDLKLESPITNGIYILKIQSKGASDSRRFIIF